MGRSPESRGTLSVAASPDPADDRPTFPLANMTPIPGHGVVEWEVIGAGEPMVWIEGGPGLPAHLARPDVALLADRFRAHLVNAPGCGRTSPPADLDGYGLQHHVRFFDDVRRAIGLGRVTVMGHSWGGLVGLALALAHPEAVRRLVVIDGYAGLASVDPEVDAAAREQAFDRVRRRPWFPAAIDAFAGDLNLTGQELDERFKACWPLYFAAPESDVSRPHLERLRRETRWAIDAVRAWDPEPPLDLRPELATLACPTLVIVGRHDFICGPAWAHAVADAIPGATYVEIEGTGHMPQYEAPDAFRAAIGAFVELHRG